MAIKENVAYFPQAAEVNPRGVLRASTRVDIVDIFGRSVSRRVSVGVSHCETLETARNLVLSARDANKGAHVEARFTVNL